MRHRENRFSINGWGHRMIWRLSARLEYSHYRNSGLNGRVFELMAENEKLKEEIKALKGK